MQARKITFLLLSAGFIFSFCLSVSAAPVTAIPKNMTVSVDGKRSVINGYNVNGNNYFKLRDFAQILSGTAKQFEVRWNNTASYVELTTGAPYTAASPDKTSAPTGNRRVEVNNLTIYVDSVRHRVSVINIDDLNYLKIRDFASILKIPVEYQQSADMILLTAGNAPKKQAYTPKDYGFGQIGAFQTTDMKGNSVSNNVFKEKPITFINYWATWCGPCRAELPEFKPMSDKYKDKVKFITIVDDGKEAKSAADKLISSYLEGFQNLLPTADLVSPIQSGAVPTTVIVDSGGYLVIDKIVGALGRYDDYIDEALKKTGQ